MGKAQTSELVGSRSVVAPGDPSERPIFVPGRNRVPGHRPPSIAGSNAGAGAQMETGGCSSSKGCDYYSICSPKVGQTGAAGFASAMDVSSTDPNEMDSAHMASTSASAPIANGERTK